jgi:hypothetical protein
LLLRITEELGGPDNTHYVPALRCIGNIVTSALPEVIERCLFANIIDKLTNLLYQTNVPIVKEALWSFSNITAGP